MSAQTDALTGLIQKTAYLFAIDMRALPEGTFETSPMGVARTPQAIAGEVAAYQRLAVEMLADRPVPSAELPTFETAEDAAAEVEAGAAALSDAIKAMSPESLQATVTAPWGQEMTKHDFAQLIAMNTMYHDGQLNYFQALHGDGEIHWH